MSILNKILEEIEERLNMVENIPINEDDDFLDCEECYETGSVQGRFEELLWCRDIICSHKDEMNNDGWIPVEERLPKKKTEKLSYDMQLVTLEDGEVCLGVYRNQENEWWTRRQQGEEVYTNVHKVVA